MHVHKIWWRWPQLLIIQPWIILTMLDMVFSQPSSVVWHLVLRWKFICISGGTYCHCQGRRSKQKNERAPLGKPSSEIGLEKKTERTSRSNRESCACSLLLNGSLTLLFDPEHGRSCEALVNFYRTKWRHIQEDSSQVMILTVFLDNTRNSIWRVMYYFTVLYESPCRNSW